MPGDVFLSDSEYAAGFGYATPSGAAQTQIVQGAGGGSGSHTSFVIWLLVFTLGSVAVLHGLRVAGFTFIFRR